MSEESLSYEEAKAELIELLQSVENGAENMDSLIATLDRAKTLVKYCQEKLRGIQKEMESQSLAGESAQGGNDT